MAALPKDTPPATHLGIDETRCGKAKFRLVEAPDRGQIGEVVADRWHVGLVDLVGGAGLLGQVEGLTAASVSAWSGARTRQWRAGIQVVAIDMCTVFKAAVCDSLSAFSGGTGVRRGAGLIGDLGCRPAPGRWYRPFRFPCAQPLSKPAKLTSPPQHQPQPE
ncbi:hypothetical protein ABZY44_11495 [Streptomyces sp. NPDC006544]|uniref:hypothetical protein n=1 Tax=Streptomyces sp. NPDC006544 TaxID=3154583 RepID=UPI0033BE00D2